MNKAHKQFSYFSCKTLCSTALIKTPDCPRKANAKVACTPTKTVPGSTPFFEKKNVKKRRGWAKSIQTNNVKNKKLKYRELKLVQVHRHDRQQHQCHVQQQHVPTTQQATNYEKSCIRMVNFICFYLCNLKRERERERERKKRYSYFRWCFFWCVCWRQ